MTNLRMAKAIATIVKVERRCCKAPSCVEEVILAVIVLCYDEVFSLEYLREKTLDSYTRFQGHTAEPLALIRPIRERGRPLDKSPTKRQSTLPSLACYHTTASNLPRYPDKPGPLPQVLRYQASPLNIPHPEELREN